jgi:peptidoglycan/xylan/chitin deacetylase (PgdA/CDA1 family)
MPHLLVLCYHAVSHSWPSMLAVTTEVMRQQIEFLLEQGYHWATFVDILKGDLPAKTAAITFDDGFRSVYENAFPLLAGLGIPATIFVPTRFVGAAGPMSWPGIDQWVGTPYENELRCVDWNQLRELQGEGWEVASHTRSHPHLPRLEDDALITELTESRERCAEELGTECRTLAYPYGEYDDRVRAAVRDLGYMGAAALRPGPPDPYRYPRVGVYPHDNLARFRIKASPAVRRARSSRIGRALERWRYRRGSDSLDRGGNSPGLA